LNEKNSGGGITPSPGVFFLKKAAIKRNMVYWYGSPTTNNMG
jgi:hypothetical protein